MFLVFFSMHYFTLKVHRRLLECHFGVLECWKKPKKTISKNCNIFEKYPKGGPLEKNFFSFLFNTEFYCGISKETMTMLFRGLTILKSPKLIIKGGLCYGFAMVILSWRKTSMKISPHFKRFINNCIAWNKDVDI